MVFGYQFYTLRMATFNAQSQSAKQNPKTVQLNDILIKLMKYDFCTLFFLNFSHLGCIRGDYLVRVLHVHRGWSSRRFNNVCKLEIPHFMKLVFFCKRDFCRSNFFRYVHYHLGGLNNTLCFRVDCITSP